MIELADVRAAAAVLEGVANRTPVLTSRTLDGMVGASVFVKAECFQRGGAFKFRGAYNKIASLDPDARARGVFAYSSGNHAQAVAIAARLLGTHATILMPEDAPAAKVDATRGLQLGSPQGEVTRAIGATIPVTCAGYDALVSDAGATRTAYYIVDGKLWGFGLLRARENPCR
jgi:threonine dehydratase